MTTTEALPDTEACTPVVTHSITLEDAATTAATLKALADPLRLRMLSAIWADPRGACCVCDFSELTDVTQPTVSHHLKVLKESGWVIAERRGTWVHYRIAPPRLDVVAALLGPILHALTSD